VNINAIIPNAVFAAAGASTFALIFEPASLEYSIGEIMAISNAF